MQTLIRLHEMRWSDGQSTAFSGGRAAFHIEFAKRALDKGWLRLWIMEIDDEPVAAWYGLRYADVDTYYQSGRDPAFERLNVGFVLLCHTIRCAFADGMRAYRFGLGDEPYKSRFAESDPGLETVAITTGARGRMHSRCSGPVCACRERETWQSELGPAGRRESVGALTRDARTEDSPIAERSATAEDRVTGRRSTACVARVTGTPLWRRMPSSRKSKIVRSRPSACVSL